MNNRQVAMCYSRAGVRVLPCRESAASGPTKSPYVAGGLHSATSDANQIASWWSKWPEALVGLPCRANGIICIDADRHGEEDGVDALLELLTTHRVDSRSIPWVVTPRDGRHLVFQRPACLSSTRGRIAPAIDVRDSAYVIAAGSVMHSGRYSLEDGNIEHLATAIAKKTLPMPPPWLQNLLSVQPKKTRVQQRTTSRSLIARRDLLAAHGRLAGLIRTAANARLGERNATLFWVACRVGDIVVEGLITAEMGMALCAEAGRSSGLSSSEAEATARSGVQHALSGGRDGRH
jgi:hypothetical protein